jgi:predicted dehydrogenase
VQNGYIGKIKEVLVNVGDPSVPCTLPAETKPEYLDWEAWVGPAPFRAFNAELSPPVEKDIYPNWRLYKEYGGGMVSDWGAHMFDIAQWGLGLDKSGPVKFIPPEGTATKGLVMIYENGIPVKHQDFGRNYGVRFIGEKGRIDISREYLDSDPVNIATATIKPDEIHLYNSPDHYLDWLDCMKTGKQPICDAETGHRTSSVCCLTNIGYWTRKTFEWDPVKEQITSDAVLNQLTKASIRGKYRLV